MVKTYGKIKEEEQLERAIISREIVKSILDYGVSQYQIQKIIYLLTMELEDRNLADSLHQLLNEVLDSSTEEKQPGLIIT